MHKVLVTSLLLVCGAANICIAQVSMDLSSSEGGSMRIGYDPTTCDSSYEGVIRYNSNSGTGGVIQICQNDAWSDWGG